MAFDGATYSGCAELDTLSALQGAKEGLHVAHCPGLAPVLVCGGKIALFALGTIMVLATLTLKLERVNAVFNNKKLTKVVFTSSMLIKRALAIVTLVAAGLAVLFVADPNTLKATVQNAVMDVDTQQRVLNVIERCDASNQPVISAILAIAIGGLIVRAAYLAYLVRNVELQEVNDTKEVALAIYNIVVLGTCGFLVSQVITEPAPQYFCTAVPIFLCSAGALIILYFPKMWKVGFYGNVDVAPLERGTSTQSSTTSIEPR
jgi:gamma-aminobutyric acid type B receptor